VVLPIPAWRCSIWQPHHQQHWEAHGHRKEHSCRFSLTASYFENFSRAVPESDSPSSCQVMKRVKDDQSTRRNQLNMLLIGARSGLRPSQLHFEKRIATHLEPLERRNRFPCLDQPRFSASHSNHPYKYCCKFSSICSNS
jgi:hypothetical protein